MNHITPPGTMISQPIHADRLRDVVLLPDWRIIGYVGQPNGEALAIEVYVEEFHSLNAEVRVRASARVPVSRFFADLARKRARQLVKWFRHVGISETWETSAPKAFKASLGERVAAFCLTLAGLAGIGASISVLSTYLKSGPLISLANEGWLGLAQYASVIFFAALATKGLAMMLSREAQKRLGIALGVIGLLGFLGWLGPFAMLFQPVPEVTDTASALLNNAPPQPASPNGSNGIGVLLLGLHLLSDWALGATVFIASGVIMARGRPRQETRTSAYILSSEMLEEARQECEIRVDALGTDLALSGEAYQAGLRLATKSGSAHYARLLKEDTAVVSMARLEVMRARCAVRTKEELDS